MKKFFSRLLVMAVVLGSILALYSCSNPDKNKVEHFNKAMAYASKGEKKAAEIEFKNALKADPKYAEARYQLGILYLEEGALKAAVEELRLSLIHI